MDDNTFVPGPTPNTVRAADGTLLAAPGAGHSSRRETPGLHAG